MRKIKRGIVVLLIVSLGLSALTSIRRLAAMQNQPPVLVLEEGEAEVLEVSTDAAEDELLEGIAASDPEDGDLTDQIFVERIVFLKDDLCDATCVVFDAQGNAGSLTRRIRYTDYESPKIGLTEPMVYFVGETTRIRKSLTAEDCIDGDITENIEFLENTTSTKAAGLYSVTVQVTNSLGDSAVLTLPVVEQEASSLAPKITLTDALVYLEQGDAFDPLTYLASVTDAGGSALSADSVTISSDVDTRTPGTYTVTYVAGQEATYTVCLAVVVE